MEDELQAVVFAGAAAVIGLVVFGGTTLAYFLGKRGSGRASDQPREGSPVRVPVRARGHDEAEVSRRAA